MSFNFLGNKNGSVEYIFSHGSNSWTQKEIRLGSTWAVFYNGSVVLSMIYFAHLFVAKKLTDVAHSYLFSSFFCRLLSEYYFTVLFSAGNMLSGWATSIRSHLDLVFLCLDFCVPDFLNSSLWKLDVLMVELRICSSIPFCTLAFFCLFFFFQKWIHKRVKTENYWIGRDRSKLVVILLTSWSTYPF